MREKVLLVVDDPDGAQNAGVFVEDFPIVPVGSSVQLFDGDSSKAANLLLENGVIKEYVVDTKYGLIVHVKIPINRIETHGALLAKCPERHIYSGALYPNTIKIP